MKVLTSLALGAFLAVCGGTAFAAERGSYPLVGTWVLSVEKSKFSGPSLKSEERTYTEADDGTVTMTITGVTSDGSRVSAGSSFKYDGKDYPLTGSPDYDALAVTKVNGTTAKFTLKKTGKIVSSGTRVLSARGTVLTLTTEATGADGKRYTSVMVFEKQ